MAKKKKDLTLKVMEEIHQKKIKMRPKTYFIVGSVLIGMGTAGALLLTVFFTHLFFFKFRIGAPFLFLRLGNIGWRPFLVSFPWLPFLLTWFGLWGGYQLLKHFDFTYRRGLLIILLSLISLTFTLGYLFDRLKPEEPLGRFRMLEPFYRHQLPPSRNLINGQVIATDSGRLMVLQDSGEAIKISTDRNTRLFLRGPLVTGKYIHIVGQWQGTDFQAEGIVETNRSCPLNEVKPPVRNGPRSCF